MEKEAEFCKCNVIHKEVIEKVKPNIPEEKKLEKLETFFKVFGDKTRLKILFALSIQEMCVCDIANLLDMGQSAISHQLRLLKQTNLVKYRKEGKIVYYSLDDSHIEELLTQGIIHIDEKFI
ncbi:MAG: transcriptional regulator [Spirochaetes bacterium GWC1_27_15]|nr:MAG: transcriptional regulator [Spirochaetes bacterium GWB1_27_13]OHD26635.1 MAG: transcriptional regulator [Spirochaetes bacterium GWC1_27_15]